MCGTGKHAWVRAPKFPAGQRPRSKTPLSMGKSLWHRDRSVRPLPGKATRDREHRGAAGHREDPRAPREDRSGSVAVRAAARSAGAADSGTADLTPGGEIPPHLR